MCILMYHKNISFFPFLRFSPCTQHRNRIQNFEYIVYEKSWDTNLTLKDITKFAGCIPMTVITHLGGLSIEDSIWKRQQYEKNRQISSTTPQDFCRLDDGVGPDTDVAIPTINQMPQRRPPISRNRISNVHFGQFLVRFVVYLYTSHARTSLTLSSFTSNFNHTQKNEHQFQHRPTETSKNYVTINSELQKTDILPTFCSWPLRLRREQYTEKNILGINSIIYTNKHIFENKIIKIIM